MAQPPHLRTSNPVDRAGVDPLRSQQPSGSTRFGRLGRQALEGARDLVQGLMGLKMGLVKREFAMTIKLRLFEALEKNAVNKVLESMRSDPNR